MKRPPKPHVTMDTGLWAVIYGPTTSPAEWVQAAYTHATQR
jgi:hypothetical protein